jgi:hypothetical protein
MELGFMGNARSDRRNGIHRTNVINPTETRYPRNRLYEERQTYRNDRTNYPTTPRREQGNQSIQCYYCSKWGHKIRECRLRQSEGSQRTNYLN